MPAFRTKSTWCPEKNREMAIEAYVDALERTILAHDLNVKCHRNMAQDEQNFSSPSVQTMKISSMYRHQIRGFTSAFLIKRLANLSIKMFAVALHASY